ncbi:MAG TPA: zf-TFIIB domain-containing protein [Kofleriaceae bacterium]
MTYRDRALACPRCGIELARHGEQDLWACPKCRGALIGETDLATQIVTIAPELAAPHDGVTMIPRKAEVALTCPVCSGELEPVFLGGAEVDRCPVDRMVWFDRGEHDQVLSKAQRQHALRSASWWDRLIDSLFGDGWAGQ